MTSYRLPRQHTRSTKRPSKFQLLKIIGKTKSVTYHFYFFVGNLPKYFNLLESMTKSYLVEFKNISDTLGCASCATFLFLPHFDVICDLLLNRRTATWNLFVKLTIKISQ